MLTTMLLVVLAVPQLSLPVVEVTADNTRVDHSCRVVIPPGVHIEDPDNNGVVHIVADGITVEFAEGARLTGGRFADRWDKLSGAGVRIENQKNVTLKNLAVSGFKLGIWATNADGLAVETVDLCDNFRQHLASTPWAEDGGDWLWPHANDKREWATSYGAALLVERSTNVTIRGVRVRRGQNGIMLDRVNDSRVYDNDCSFLSGWGLAMWRSSRNTISRNAFDFCVRGYSDGVYNRGQDSAGILCFEQCSDNFFLENSVTHSGDGFFGFAGKEALGDVPPSDKAFDYNDKGCNRNIFAGNDFSYAPAHGLELTFSFDNRVYKNRIVENAICGIWGGYSQRTIIDENTLERNGLPGRGEGGGINIEHGFRNVIAANAFSGNTIGVSFWDDDDGELLKSPWALANHHGSDQNRIERSSFTGDATAVRLRRTPLTGLTMNTYANVAKELDADDASTTQPFHLRQGGIVDPVTRPLGNSRPVGARDGVAGRSHIIMDDWGPWDHASPMVRLASRNGSGDTYEIRGTTPAFSAENLKTGEKKDWPAVPQPTSPLTLSIAGDGDYSEYAWKLVDGQWTREVHGTIVRAAWNTVLFPNKVDPRTDVAAWRTGAKHGARVTLTSLELPFGYAGPAPLIGRASPESATSIRELGITNKQFGLIAESSLRLPAGTWRFRIQSDDGVRLTVNGETVIDHWTLHAPAEDVADVTLAEGKLIPLKLEYFQLDGFAVLTLAVERVAEAVPTRSR